MVISEGTTAIYATAKSHHAGHWQQPKRLPDRFTAVPAARKSTHVPYD